MKKILALMLCVVLLCATSIVAFAEEDSSAVAEPNTSVTDNSTTSNETATEGEISADTNSDKTLTDTIIEWVQTNFEEISVVVTLIATAYYNFRKHRTLNGSIGTLNNNAITVAQNSADAINKALAEVGDIANVVNSYKDEIATLLGEIRKSAEEKQSLETTLAHVETFLKTAKLATVELSNEVAELLVLANIPNSKKDELYARHTKAINALEEAEEVMTNDGTQA